MKALHSAPLRYTDVDLSTDKQYALALKDKQTGVTRMITKIGSALLLAAVVSGCQSTGQTIAHEQFLPRINPDLSVISSEPIKELIQLQLVATNLVSALVQVPELQPASATLQVSQPTTPFGNAVIRSLEDAGFGLQRVSADQGANYVTYGKRFSETEAGPVTDFDIAVGSVQVKREFTQNDSGIFPSSLMSVSGTHQVTDIVLNDEIFREQGGDGEFFISGVESAEDAGERGEVDTVQVNAYDTTPQGQRTAQERVLMQARERFFEVDSDKAAVDLSKYKPVRRTTLIFDTKETRVMGRGNKQAIRLLVREFQPKDIYEVTACTDADGHDETARMRAIRVEEEFISYGIEPDAVYLAPCIRASFRHSTDNSPVPVVIVQHRAG